ncbi:uncharacterized protein I303_106478 [Kwoniella dejecticola CBS 10117]|uniref:GLTSCR protein conserved domain-containing protein n=1 Tax=Kwoniella dejecticola CBS 10117 TaxID=1296121 RepID=A0A1A5ZUL1_9TREE|nr:uncharacterized protein I303_08264 [Kwoniella dejecticola CBS 10117]OBR81494.1 hypothetical protein I303_08264 [Kwoniella dejecticola CBS 10117]
MSSSNGISHTNNQDVARTITPSIKVERNDDITVDVKKESSLPPQAQAHFKQGVHTSTSTSTSTSGSASIVQGKAKANANEDADTTLKSESQSHPNVQPFPGQVNAEAGPSSPPPWEKELMSKKRKWALMGYEEDERDLLEDGYMNLNLALLMDQTSTLYPSPPTKFTSYGDVVDRLLPYHVWQVHDEDLDGSRRSKAQEQLESREAENLLKRVLSVKDRFGKIRRREADWPSNLLSLISIYQQSNQDTKEEVSSLQGVLRPLNAEYAAIENELKRIQDEKDRIANEKRRAEQARIKAIEDEKRRVEDEKRRIAEAQRRKQEQLEQEEERKRMDTERRKKEDEQRRTAMQTQGQQNQNQKQHQSQNTPQSASTVTQHFTTAASPLIPNASSTPSSASASLPTTSRANSDRGKPRGRPRGRGRGGTRESAQSHMSTSASTAASASTSAPNGFGNINNTPSPASLPPISLGPGSPAASATSTTGGLSTQNPVSITVSISILPQLVALGLLVIPPIPPDTPKTPATILRNSEDRKSVVLSIHLGQCTKAQLLALARVLNVSSKVGLSGAATSTGTGPGTGVSPAPVTPSASTSTSAPAPAGQTSTPQPPSSSVSDKTAVELVKTSDTT